VEVVFCEEAGGCVGTDAKKSFESFLTRREMCVRIWGGGECVGEGEGEWRGSDSRKVEDDGTFTKRRSGKLTLKRNTYVC
jgi:hypothetical protein